MRRKLTPWLHRSTHISRMKPGTPGFFVPRDAVGNSSEVRGSHFLKKGKTQMSQLLNIEEAVHQFPYWKPRTLRAFVKDGTLPCYRLGKRLYFRPSDLEAFIEAHYSPAKKPGRSLRVVSA